jgi:beta-lactamase regulating signal transducer with metallopeptidase domain
MMLLWMIYAVVVGALAAIAGLALERAGRVVRIATRWIWAAAILLAIGLSMRAPAAPEYAPDDAAFDTGTRAPAAFVAAGWHAWLDGAWQRARESTRWLDVARGVRAGGGSMLGRVGDRGVIVAWLVLSAMVALAFVGVHVRLRRARARWPRAELHGVEVRVSSRVGPAAIGFVRPEIVVPAWLLARSSAEQEMAIAHETSHSRARDPLLLGAAWIALILFPWNAALWFMMSRLRLAIEVDCDRRVLRDGASPRAYGTLLVAVAELASPIRPSALALADDSSHLKTRILAMDTHLPKFGRVRAGLATLFGVVAVLAACEAKEPTAADVDAMSGVAAEKTAKQLGLLRSVDTGFAYVVDSVRVSPEAARRIGSSEIATMSFRRDGNSPPEVDITTKGRNAPIVKSDTDVVFEAARRGHALQTQASGDTTIAWFVNGVRVDYAAVRALDRGAIETIDVLKGTAASQEYGTAAGQKVIAIRTKGAGSSK